jgi:uncharacterized cupin superfamily protein
MADWFIVNVADAPALSSESNGAWTGFERPEALFENFGINIHMLYPGKPNGLYHSENVQEDFLVLTGECLAILDGEERKLGAWDFVHCPPGTEHVFVGAGDDPCAVLMVGARGPDATVHYPVNELAAKYGASVKEATSDPNQAYADWDSNYQPTKLPWPPAAGFEPAEG